MQISMEFGFHFFSSDYKWRSLCLKYHDISYPCSCIVIRIPRFLPTHTPSNWLLPVKISTSPSLTPPPEPSVSKTAPQSPDGTSRRLSVDSLVQPSLSLRCLLSRLISSYGGLTCGGSSRVWRKFIFLTVWLGREGGGGKGRLYSKPTLIKWRISVCTALGLVDYSVNYLVSFSCCQPAGYYTVFVQVQDEEIVVLI